MLTVAGQNRFSIPMYEIEASIMVHLTTARAYDRVRRFAARLNYQFYSSNRCKAKQNSSVEDTDSFNGARYRNVNPPLWSAILARLKMKSSTKLSSHDHVDLEPLIRPWTHQPTTSIRRSSFGGERCRIWVQPML
jgi:hypothetical protein